MDDHLSFEGIRDTLSLGNRDQDLSPSLAPLPSAKWEDEVYHPLDGVDLHTDTFRFSASPPRRSGPSAPDDWDDYARELLRCFGGLDEALVERLFGEKLLVSAYKSWDPKEPRSNLLLAQRSFEILSRAMGDTYSFSPSPLCFGSLYRDNAVGHFLYGKGWEKVVLSRVLLTRPYPTLLEVMVHEQIHRLQHSLICRLNQPGHPLPEEWHRLVLYWLRDEPNRMKRYEVARRYPKEAQRILRRIAIEYHAYERSEYVIGRLFP